MDFNDSILLHSPFFWVGLLFGFGGLAWAKPQMTATVGVLISAMALVLLFARCFWTAGLVVVLLGLFALPRRNRPLGYVVLTLLVVFDLLNSTFYGFDLVQYYQMTAGSGITLKQEGQMLEHVHLIPGELTEGMQATLVALVAGWVITILWGGFLYRSSRSIAASPDSVRAGDEP